MTDNILKTKLDNGLTVVLKGIPTAPVTTCWTWYKVGSRHETPGITGAAHWVEHMLSARLAFEGRDLFSTYARLGGVNNAGTSFDYTHYYATLPPDRIETAMRVAASRMATHELHPDATERERTVIISERQWLENNPQHVLFENMLSTAFQIHPYRHEPIGYMHDLKTMDSANLQQFCDTYYTPNNALLVMVGPFAPTDFLARVKALFADIAPGPEPPETAPPEPPQRGERRFRIEGPGSTAYVEVAYHTPPPNHADFFAVVVLDTILAGAGSLAVIGDGSSNVSSRLYRALVNAELATDVWGSLYSTVDPYLYAISATVRAGRTPAEVEAALDVELDRIQEQPIKEDDIARATKQARAMFVYGAESVTKQGFWYGFSEVFADYAWFETYVENLRAVTVEDVQRAAQTYLSRSNRTVGWYVPTNPSTDPQENAKEKM